MRKAIILVLLITAMAIQVGTIYAIEDLRAYPTGRLGYIRAGYDLPPDWTLDVWVDPTIGAEKRPVGPPTFSLPMRGGQEWETTRYGIIRVYAEAWIWDQGRRVIVAVSRMIQAEASPNRGYGYGYGWGSYQYGGAGYDDGYVYLPGYGWGIEFQLRHFDLSYWRYYKNYQYPYRGPQRP